MRTNDFFIRPAIAAGERTLFEQQRRNAAGGAASAEPSAGGQTTMRPEPRQRWEMGRYVAPMQPSGMEGMPGGASQQRTADTPMRGSAPPMGSEEAPMRGSVPPMGSEEAPMQGSVPPMGAVEPPMDVGMPMQNQETAGIEVTPGTTQWLLSEHVGYFVICDFLIGTQQLVTRQGILYQVGSGFMVLYDDINDNYTVCDFYSLKFITFYDTMSTPRNLRNGRSR